MLPAVILLGLSLTLLALRWFQPWVGKPPGVMVREIPLPFRTKVRAQRANVYALAILLLLGAAGGWIPPLLELAVIAVAMMILLLPTRYTLTDQGIALGRTRPRRWTEFAAANVRRGLVVLEARNGGEPLPVWLPVSSARDQRVVLMNQLIAREEGPGTRVTSRKRR